MNKEDKLLELNLESIILDLVYELDYDFYTDVNLGTCEDEELARNKIKALTEILRRNLEDLKLIPSRHDT
jgi:hypothetical protein